MSAAERVNKSVRDTIKSAEEFIDNTKKSLQAELSKTTPKIEHALDQSLDEAGLALTNALKSVEKKTNREQLEVLNGYRTFLQGQIAFVDDRIKAIKKG
jgi:signal transduction protein with GAF and PtsI domain